MTWPGSGEVAGDQDPVTAMQVRTIRHSLLRVWGESQQTRPLIVAPVCTSIPFEAAADLADGAVTATIQSMRMATAVNTLGLPGSGGPSGHRRRAAQVVPVIGPRYREDLCLDAAAALEDRAGTITPIDPR